jgi:hypothetical protein
MISLWRSYRLGIHPRCESHGEEYAVDTDLYPVFRSRIVEIRKWLIGVFATLIVLVLSHAFRGAPSDIVDFNSTEVQAKADATFFSWSAMNSNIAARSVYTQLLCHAAI